MEEPEQHPHTVKVWGEECKTKKEELSVGKLLPPKAMLRNFLWWGRMKTCASFRSIVKTSSRTWSETRLVCAERAELQFASWLSSFKWCRSQNRMQPSILPRNSDCTGCRTWTLLHEEGPTLMASFLKGVICLFHYQSLLGTHQSGDNPWLISLSRLASGIFRASSSVPWSRGPAGDGQSSCSRDLQTGSEPPSTTTFPGRDWEKCSQEIAEPWNIGRVGRTISWGHGGETGTV